jgi:hypothetical protein
VDEVRCFGRSVVISQLSRRPTPDRRVPHVSRCSRHGRSGCPTQAGFAWVGLLGAPQAGLSEAPSAESNGSARGWQDPLARANNEPRHLGPMDIPNEVMLASMECPKETPVDDKKSELPQETSDRIVLKTVYPGLMELALGLERHR